MSSNLTRLNLISEICDISIRDLIRLDLISEICDIPIQDLILIEKCKISIETYVQGVGEWAKRDDGFGLWGIGKGFIYDDYINSKEEKPEGYYNIYIRVFPKTGHWYIGCTYKNAWERHCEDFEIYYRNTWKQTRLDTKIGKFYRNLTVDDPVMIATIDQVYNIHSALYIETQLINHFSNPSRSSLPVELCLNTDDCYNIQQMKNLLSCEFIPMKTQPTQN
jgi:hypothetical protein